MNYAIIAISLITSFYSISFAKYNWKSKNKRAAVGVILLTLGSVLIPLTAVIIR